MANPIGFAGGKTLKNKDLALDYIERCEKRLLAIEVLFKHQSWADVVRQCQEVVELATKAFLRAFHIEPPRIHDVSFVLEEEIESFPKEAQKLIPRAMELSHNLRRDRELAFYGSEDLTPSKFYQKKDADKAFKETQWLVKELTPFIKKLR